MIKYNPDIHHRRSIRLKGYDYSQRGHYFITICAQNRICLFGKIENGEIQLNDAGSMILDWYAELENKFQDIRCDAIICMPNHIHFIVENIVGADLCVRPSGARPSGARPSGARPSGARPLCARPDINPNIRPDTTPNDHPDEIRENGQTHGKGQTHGNGQTHGKGRHIREKGRHAGLPLRRLVPLFNGSKQ